MDLSPLSIHAWLTKHSLVSETGKPISYREHLFWYDILSDMSPKQVWLKAAQVGGSTAAILKTFWLAKFKGMDCIYTLPTDSDVRDFVGGKVNRLVDNNPVLQQYVADRDTIEQKKLGENVIYYRGTFTNRAALMVSADLVVSDEVDRSNQAVVEQYSSRLQHSKHGWEWYFSNPSSPANGVGKRWQKSDQKHWFITCGGCSKKQYLSWPDSIDEERKVFQCKACKKALTDEERRVGKWHAKITETVPEYSGYWVSLLMAPWVSAEHVLKLHAEKSEEYFTNFVLGLPYVGSGNTVDRSVLLKNLKEGDGPKDAGRIVIGVDTGTTTWWVAGNKAGLLDYGSCKGYDDIERMLKRFPRSVAVFDAGGDLMAPRELQERYRGRIFLCSFSADRKTQQLIRWGEGAETGHVLADRNRMFQLVVDEFSDERIPIHGDEAYWEDYFSHWGNVYRTSKENALGVEVKSWERSGSDHLCFIAGTQVRTESGPKPIELVEPGEKVWTRNGLEEVFHSGLTQEKAEIFSISFTNDKTLEGTGEHPIWVKGVGFVPLLSLRYWHIIGAWKSPLSRTKESISDVIRTLKTGRSVSISHRGLEQDKKVSNACMKRFGWKAMGLFRKVFASITRTKIPSIIPLRILSAFQNKNTSQTMRKPVGLTLNIEKEPLSTLEVSSPFLMLGKGLRKGKDIIKGLPSFFTTQKIGLRAFAIGAERLSSVGGVIRVNIISVLLTAIKGIIKSVSHIGIWLIGNALFALRFFRRISGLEEKAVLGFVQIKSYPRKQGNAPVYGLSVNGTPEYFANDILVSNCLATIYYRIGMERFGGEEGGILGGSLIQEFRTAPEVGYDGRMRSPLVLPEKYDGE